MVIYALHISIRTGSFSGLLNFELLNMLLKLKHKTYRIVENSMNIRIFVVVAVAIFTFQILVIIGSRLKNKLSFHYPCGEWFMMFYVKTKLEYIQFYSQHLTLGIINMLILDEIPCQLILLY